jgi:hypothetical protein
MMMGSDILLHRSPEPSARKRWRKSKGGYSTSDTIDRQAPFDGRNRTAIAAQGYDFVAGFIKPNKKAAPTSWSGFFVIRGGKT